MNVRAFLQRSDPARDRRERLIGETAAVLTLYSTTARRVRRELLTDATNRGPRSDVRVGPRHDPPESREDRRERTLAESVGRAPGAQLTRQGAQALTREGRRSGLIEAPVIESSDPASLTAARDLKRRPSAMGVASAVTTQGEQVHEQHR